MHTLVRALVLISVSLLKPIAIAAPPNIDCLTDLSFGEAYFNEAKARGPLIVLVGDQTASNPDETWAIWQEPEVFKFVKERMLVVAYIDDDTTDQPWLKALQPESRPLIIYRDRKGKEHRKTIEQFPQSAAQLIEWLKYPSREADQRRSKELNLLHQIAQNPDQLSSRLQLIELYKASSESALLRHQLVPWLLLNLDLWHQQERHGLSEKEFQLKIFEMIRSAREELDLFGRVSTRIQKGKVFDTWIENQYADSRGFWSGIVHPVKGMQWQWANMLKPHYIDADPENLTDREQFILKALTAEGEEWEQLKKQYQKLLGETAQ